MDGGGSERSAGVEVGVGVHPGVVPLSYLLGTWRGQGEGGFPTISTFQYGEELHFSHPGNKPVIAYSQKTWKLNSGEPMHAEAGYWRPKPDGTLEVVISQSTGLLELQPFHFCWVYPTSPGRDTCNQLISVLAPSICQQAFSLFQGRNKTVRPTGVVSPRRQSGQYVGTPREARHVSLVAHAGHPANSPAVRGPVRWGVMLGLSHIAWEGHLQPTYKRTGPLHLSTGLFPLPGEEQNREADRCRFATSPKRTICWHTARGQKGTYNAQDKVVKLHSELVANASKVREISRVFKLVNGELSYVVEMATSLTSLQPHLKASLKKL